MGLRKILFVVLAVAAVTACQMGGGMYGARTEAAVEEAR